MNDPLAIVTLSDGRLFMIDCAEDVRSCVLRGEPGDLIWLRTPVEEEFSAVASAIPKEER